MKQRCVLRVVSASWIAIGGLLGCTAESTRIAIESQERANQVQEAIFDRQHEGLTQFLYDAMIRRLEAAAEQGSLGAEQRLVLNEAWNERDLIEFWRVQFERSKALRLAGVDAKLFSEQAVIDLLIKALNAKLERGKQAVASASGSAAADRMSVERRDVPGGTTQAAQP